MSEKANSKKNNGSPSAFNETANQKIGKFLEVVSRQTEAVLERELPLRQGDAARLMQAMRYSVFNGGKRLRPALFCAVVDILGGEREKLLPFAAAVEMIHCYSLIHDDLPAMDDDDQRRGKPSCHIAFDEATAILAGDGLLSLAAQIMARPIEGISPTHHQAAAEAVMTGAFDMVQGQAAELSAVRPDKELLTRIYSGKTCGLFRAALLSAAHLCGADPKHIEILEEYGENLGLAFQIADDILDIEGKPETTGRPAGSDAKNSKQTMAVLLGCMEARRRAGELAQRAVQNGALLPQDGGMLALFPDFLADRAMVRL